MKFLTKENLLTGRMRKTQPRLAFITRSFLLSFQPTSVHFPMVMKRQLSNHVTLTIVCIITLFIEITATYDIHHDIVAAASTHKNRETGTNSNSDVISSHSSFRRGTKAVNQASDADAMELCYRYLMQSDENKNGVLSSEEYMAFIHRLSLQLQAATINPDDRTGSTAEKKYDDDTKHDTIRTNVIRLESIMVFNHLSHQTSTNQPSAQHQEQQTLKDTPMPTTCTSNTSGEVNCADSSVSSIWLGGNPTNQVVKRQWLRTTKASEPLIRSDVYHFICDEVLIAMDLHTPHSLTLSRYGSASSQA